MGFLLETRLDCEVRERAESGMAAGFLLELRVDGDAIFLDEKGWGTMTSFISHGLPAQCRLDFTLMSFQWEFLLLKASRSYG